MTDNWQPKPLNYPHFDKRISPLEAINYVSSKSNVNSHKFFPLIRVDKKYKKFSKSGNTRQTKIRTIRYAARKDSYIYSYYRHLLCPSYESKLNNYGLNESILAYRRITNTNGQGCSNIDFAKTAFDKIKLEQNSIVIALDIKGFFDNICHKQLKSVWLDLLNIDTNLPSDHFQVYKSVTHYSEVERDALYLELGHLGDKIVNGKQKFGYLTKKKEFSENPQLCSSKDFRDKVAKPKNRPTLIKTNGSSKGIPQGVPISDLLANAYLLEFDKKVKLLTKELKGDYFRYSDDMLFILPDKHKIQDYVKFYCNIQQSLNRFGGGLTFSAKKTAIYKFKRIGAIQDCEQLNTNFQVIKRKTALEYLGFSFDGKQILIKSSTLNNLYRKVTKQAYVEVRSYRKRYANWTEQKLKDKFNYGSFLEKFGNVRSFNDLNDSSYKSWTFKTYVKRAIKTFKHDKNGIEKQLKNFKKKSREIVKAKLLEKINS